VGEFVWPVGLPVKLGAVGTEGSGVGDTTNVGLGVAVGLVGIVLSVGEPVRADGLTVTGVGEFVEPVGLPVKLGTEGSVVGLCVGTITNVGLRVSVGLVGAVMSVGEPVVADGLAVIDVGLMVTTLVGELEKLVGEKLAVGVVGLTVPVV
jgi:hypothetical protein